MWPPRQRHFSDHSGGLLDPNYSTYTPIIFTFLYGSNKVSLSLSLSLTFSLSDLWSICKRGCNDRLPVSAANEREIECILS